ncbi:MAG: hypothetical protein WCN92_12690 [Eubacteriales bacterium]
MSELIDSINCRALNREIEIGYCSDLGMAADDMIIWDGIEDHFSEAQISICKKCPKRKDLTAV